MKNSEITINYPFYKYALDYWAGNLFQDQVTSLEEIRLFYNNRVSNNLNSIIDINEYLRGFQNTLIEYKNEKVNLLWSKVKFENDI